MKRPLVRIPIEHACDFTGRKVHVWGVRPGCVWVFERLLPGNVALLRAPKSGREQYVHIRDLCYLRGQEPKP